MFPYIDFIIGSQLCGVIATVTILIFFIIQRKLSIRNEFYFLRCVIITIISGVLDVISTILNTRMPNELITIIFAKIYLISMVLTLASVVLYIAGDTVSKKRYNVIFFVSIILSVIVSFLTMVLDLEVIDVYTEGTATNVMYFSAAVVITFIIVFNIKYRKSMIRDKSHTIYIWMASWGIFALIQFLFPKILMVSFGVSFGTIIIYLKLEAVDNIVDKDTGLFNWNSYLKYINEMRILKKKCSIIYLKPSDDFNNLDEKMVYNALSSFNDIIRKRKDVTAFSLRKEYLLVCDSDKILDIRKFLDEKRNLEYVVADTYTAYYLDDIFKLKYNNDLEALVAYVSNRYNDYDDLFVKITDDAIESFYSLDSTKKLIKSAIDEDRILVYFQPIYNISECRFKCAEALVRIIDNEGALLAPDVFIPVAESTGLINDLDYMVFEKVCRFISESDMEALGLEYIEINLSGAQLSDAKLSSKYISLMKKYNVDSKYINLEITESASIEHHKSLKKNLREFLNEGITFSLDDYGTGYSNLNYVVEMPVEIVKFDKQMTDAYFLDSKAKYVMEYSIKMFKSMNLKIVIEGVEKKEQLDELAKMDVEYIQGYYFSKPINETSFVAFLKENNTLKKCED